MNGGELLLPKEGLLQSPVLVEVAPSVLTGANTSFKVGVYSQGRKIETVETMFVGPR